MREFQGMPWWTLIVIFVVANSLALAGFISNAFIVAVIIIAWAKCGSLTTSQWLSLSLAVCNICYTAAQLVFMHIFYLMPNSSTIKSTFFFCVFTTLARYWLTALLCVFYCIKIVNSSHVVFRWCKQRISRIVAGLLATSAVSAFFLSLAFIQYVQLPSNTTANTASVAQEEEMTFQLAAFLIPAFLVFGSCSPLLVVLLSCFLIVAFLCRHVFQMTDEGPRFRSPQVEAHCKAAGAVLFHLFLYVSFYVAHTLLLTQIFRFSHLLQHVCLEALLVYAPAQAALLVLVNPQLKQAAAQVLSRTRLLCTSAM